MSDHRIGDITIRPFDPQSDSDRLKEIVAGAWRGAGGALMEQQYGLIGARPWSDWLTRDILAYLQGEYARSFVAEKGGQIVGFCSYVVDPPRKCGTVGYNAVAPGHQGSGIGSVMMNFVMAGLRREGMEYALVLVADNEEHAPARRVYEKHGFRRLTGYHELVQKL